MSDEGFTGGEVFTISATGGKPSIARRGARLRSAPFSGPSPSKMLLTEFAGGSSAITTLDVSTGRSERLWQGDENLHAGGNYREFFPGARR